jgi:hypothetical protein
MKGGHTKPPPVLSSLKTPITGNQRDSVQPRSKSDLGTAQSRSSLTSLGTMCQALTRTVNWLPWNMQGKHVGNREVEEDADERANH